MAPSNFSRFREHSESRDCSSPMVGTVGTVGAVGAGGVERVEDDAADGSRGDGSGDSDGDAGDGLGAEESDIDVFFLWFPSRLPMGDVRLQPQSDTHTAEFDAIGSGHRPEDLC